MTKRALISVSDKAGIVEFAQELKKLGWDIISTGGTKVALDNAGVSTIAIDDSYDIFDSKYCWRRLQTEVSGVDTGKIIKQVRVPRLADDTIDSFEARIHEAEYKLYPEVVKTLFTDWLFDDSYDIFDLKLESVLVEDDFKRRYL